jgi:hypothetical protein
MPIQIARRMRYVLSAALIGAPLLAPELLSADVIRLKNGGEVRGLISKTSQPSDLTLLIRTTSGAELLLERSEIDFVSTRSPLIEEYYTKARRMPDTVEAHWDLAGWCLHHQMQTQRREQLELITELDPNHEEAHKSLGHIRHNGEWMSRDEAMARQGYVKHKGKYVTQIEYDLLEKTAVERSAEAEWHPKVRRWVAMLTDRDAIRRTDGEESLRKIRDPNAVTALNQFLASHENPLGRRMFVEIVSQIDGKKPVRRLVDRVLNDSDAAVRQAALAGIRQEHAEEAVRYLLPGLKEKDNAIIRRAAVGLQKFGDDRVVPNLIAALISTHRVKVQVPNQQALGFANNQGTGVQQIDPRLIGTVLPTEIEGMALTGQLPYGAVVLPDPNQIIRVATLNVDVRNEEVLTALQRITGKDFGFDQRNWQRWHAATSGGRT